MKNVIIILFMFPFIMTAQKAGSLFEEGSEAIQNGNYKKAIKLFEKSINKGETVDSSYYNKALCQIKLEEYESAVEGLFETVEKTENKALKIEALYKACFVQRRTNDDYTVALGTINKGIEIDPTDFRLHYTRGHILSDAEKYEESLESYDKAIELHTSDPDLFYHRAKAKRYLKQYTAAIEDYSKVLEIDPNYRDAYFGLGYANMKKENYEEAIKHFDEAIKLMPSAFAFNNRGFSKYKLGQLESAEEDCETSTLLDPNNPWAYYNLGLIAYEQGKKKKACKFFNKAHKFKGMDFSKEIEEKCK